MTPQERLKMIGVDTEIAYLLMSIAKYKIDDIAYSLDQLGADYDKTNKRRIYAAHNTAGNLSLQVKRLDADLFGTKDEDDTYENIAWLSKMVSLIVDRCGNDLVKREQAFNMIHNGFRSELNLKL